MWEIFSHTFKCFQKHFQLSCIICDNLINTFRLLDVEAGDRFYFVLFLVFCSVVISNPVRPSSCIKFCCSSGHFFKIKS